MDIDCDFFSVAVRPSDLQKVTLSLQFTREKLKKVQDPRISGIGWYQLVGSPFYVFAKIGDRIQDFIGALNIDSFRLDSSQIREGHLSSVAPIMAGTLATALIAVAVEYVIVYGYGMKSPRNFMEVLDGVAALLEDPIVANANRFDIGRNIRTDRHIHLFGYDRTNPSVSCYRRYNVFGGVCDIPGSIQFDYMSEEYPDGFSVRMYPLSTHIIKSLRLANLRIPDTLAQCRTFLSQIIRVSATLADRYRAGHADGGRIEISCQAPTLASAVDMYGNALEWRFWSLGGFTLDRMPTDLICSRMEESDRFVKETCPLLSLTGESPTISLKYIFGDMISRVGVANGRNEGYVRRDFARRRWSWYRLLDHSLKESDIPLTDVYRIHIRHFMLPELRISEHERVCPASLCDFLSPPDYADPDQVAIGHAVDDVDGYVLQQWIRIQSDSRDPTSAPLFGLPRIQALAGVIVDKLLIHYERIYRNSAMKWISVQRADSDLAHFSPDQLKKRFQEIRNVE